MTLLGGSEEVRVALLHARPDTLVCRDGNGEIQRVQPSTRPTEQRFDRIAPWEELALTDLLVIDVRGSTEPLREELHRHEKQVGRFLAIIGTPGRVQARSEADQSVEEFLLRGGFRLRQGVDDGIGLSILERV